MVTTAPAPRKNMQQMTPTKIGGTIAYAAGQTIQLAKMDRTMFYRSINLRFTGSITTTATSTVANLSGGDEWGLVQRINLVANGGNYIRSISGEQLVMVNYLLQGYLKNLTSLVGAAGTYTFDSTLPLWMCLPGNMGKAIDATLNATLLSDLYLSVTWGNPANINAAAGTTVSASTQIEVSQDQAFFLDPTIVPAFSLTQLQAYTFQNIPQTGQGTQGYNYQIPVGQTYPFILINAKNTGTNVDNATALTGSGIIQSGTNQLYNMDMVTEAAMNNFRGYIPFFSFSQFLNNTNNNFAAWRLFKFPKQQYLSESLNLVNFQNCSFYIQNNQGSAVDITVIPLTLFPTKQITG
jgi:hypothetical protein